MLYLVTIPYIKTVPLIGDIVNRNSCHFFWLIPWGLPGRPLASLLLTANQKRVEPWPKAFRKILKIQGLYTVKSRVLTRLVKKHM